MRNDVRQVDDNTAPGTTGGETHTQKNTKYAKMQQYVQVHVLIPPPSIPFSCSHCLSINHSLSISVYVPLFISWPWLLRMAHVLSMCASIDLYVKRYVVHHMIGC